MILGLQERFVSKAAILGLDQEKHQECCVPLPVGKCQQLPAGFAMAVRLLSPTPAQESVNTFPFCSNYDLCCSLWWFSFAKPFNSLPPLFLYKGKKYLPRAYMLFFSMIREERKQERNVSSLTCSKGNFLPITHQFHHFLQLCSSFCSDFYSVKMYYMIYTKEKLHIKDAILGTLIYSLEKSRSSIICGCVGKRK